MVCLAFHIKQLFCVFVFKFVPLKSRKDKRASSQSVSASKCLIAYSGLNLL